jgi:hypothetical protein
MALKCIYTLLKNNKLTDRPKVFGLLEQIRTNSPQVNIHLLKIISLLAVDAPAEQLVETYIRTVSGFMLRATHKTEFDFAEALCQWMISSLR